MSKNKSLNDGCGTAITVDVSGCCVVVRMESEESGVGLSVATLFASETRRLEKMLRKARKAVRQDQE